MKKTQKSIFIAKQLGINDNYIFLEAFIQEETDKIAGTVFEKDTVYPVFLKLDTDGNLDERNLVYVIQNDKMITYASKGYSQLKIESKYLTLIGVNDYLDLIKHDKKENNAKEGEF